MNLLPGQTLYRGYLIAEECPPIPIPQPVYQFQHLDWDLGDGRHGYESSLEAAKALIDEMEEG